MPVRTRSLSLLLLISSVACDRQSANPSTPKLEPHSQTQDSIAFSFTPVEHASNSWTGNYTSSGRTTVFRIELGPLKPMNEKEFSMFSGHGKFIHVPGSDRTALLPDLARVLQAKKIPISTTRLDILPFDYVILGQNQSRSADGAFGDSPKGSWTAMKIFLGDDEGEVFLNFNATDKMAEFSIKDSDYGDYLIAQLAKVL